MGVPCLVTVMICHYFFQTVESILQVFYGLPQLLSDGGGCHWCVMTCHCVVACHCCCYMEAVTVVS